LLRPSEAQPGFPDWHQGTVQNLKPIPDQKDESATCQAGDPWNWGRFRRPLLTADLLSRRGIQEYRDQTSADG
jgi:hypothetical protein